MSTQASPAAVPVAAPLPKAALPVAAAAPVPHSPLPVAAAAPAAAHAAHAAPSSGAKVPVAATAPRLVPPTAAPISAAAPAAKSGGGGLFGTIARLQMKMEGVASKHAPSLVTAIKEQVAAASMHSEAQELQKQKQLETYKAIDQPASASSAASTDAVAESTTSPGAPVPSPAKLVRKPSANAQVMHIPGLGAVAIAAPSTAADSEKQARDAHVWKNLPKDSPANAGAGAGAGGGPAATGEDPALALERLAQESNLSPSATTLQPGAEKESELRRRKGAPSAGDSATSSSKASLPEALPVSSPSLGSTPSSSGSSGSGLASTSTKMDLPLRLCLVILKKSSGEMRDRYAEYLKTKSARGEGDEPLSFSQFMFFSTIRTLPDFLFKKTELSYCMMREEGDTLVFEENFVRYAPILAPLASKLDARRLYQALQGASIAAGAALTVEQVAMEEVEMEAEALMARDTSTTGAASSSSTGGDDLPDLAAVSASAASSSIPSTSPPKLRAGGVGYVQFKHYVESLKKFVKKGSPDNGWPEVFSSFPELTKAGPQEQLLLVRTGVTDTTTFPPHIGRLGITTNFLLYESSFFKRKRAIRWSNITRIERNDQGFWRQKAAALSSVVSSHSAEASSARGINIYIREDEAASDASGIGGSSGKVSKRAEECLTWDQPGWGQDAVVERTRTFEYMQIMLALQRLVASLPDKVVASALVQETCMSMLRMRALEAVGPGVNPLLLNPFSQENISATRTATAAASSKLSAATSSALAAVDSSSFSAGAAAGSSPPASAGSSFVASIAASISRADTIRKSKSSWLFAVLPGLQDRAKENLEEDIDPELYAGGNYKTAEELALLARAVEQPFSLKNFAYNVKLFRHEIDPILLFFALVRRVRDWENPLLTLATVMLLLNMAYRDLLMYLPALIILINIALLATLKYYPHAVAAALNAGVVKKTDEAASASASSSSSSSSGPALAEDMLDGTETKEEREALLSADAAKVSAKRGKDDDPESSGLIARLKNYRDVAVRTKDYLHSVQNQVGEYNVKFMKVEGLYKWRSPAITQKFFLQLCVAFLVMVFIPFRFIFPIIILDFFTTKWQRSSGFERMLEEVSLPAQMPDVD